MNKNTLVAVIVLLFFCFGAFAQQNSDSRFLSYTTKPSSVVFYWKDDKGKLLKSIQNLKAFIESKKKKLTFAMNGGMYKKDNTPQGLFIEKGITLTPLDTLSGGGNFYLKPNGVFYITQSDSAAICVTEKFSDSGKIKFATQSGPMLLIDGEIHPAFKKGSTNFNIRNGVGILPDGSVLFVISKQEVNFYEFADFFKSMNCRNALYLDGFVSRVYLPEESWTQLDGNFGVIIGVSN